MKTRTNRQKSCILLFALAIAISSGNVKAQADPEMSAGPEAINAMSRLYTMMAAFEKELRYSAPSGDEENVNLILDRLEMVTAHVSREVIYEAPENEEITKSVSTTLNDSDKQLTELIRKTQNRKKI